MPATNSTKLNVLTPARPWYAEGLQFTCSQCGNCCTGAPGYVWISDVEIRRLADHLKLSEREVIRRYCRKIGQRYSLKENRNHRGDYDCIFLKEIPVPASDGNGEQVVHSKRVCEIYHVRPLQCRTWPFWDGNLASPAAWENSTKRCPGMGRGRSFRFDEIEKLRTAEDWPDRPPTSDEAGGAG